MHYSLTRATIWNLVGYLYLLIAALISTPIIIHNLGLSLFGQYSLIIATLILVSSLDFGLPQAVVRALVRARNKHKDREVIWSTSSVLFISSGVVGGLLALLITFNYRLSDTSYLSIFFICLLNNILGHYTTLPQSEGHFGYYNVKTFIVGTGNTLLTAFITSHGFQINEILILMLASYLFSLFPLAYFSLKFFPNPRRLRPSLMVARSLLSFGIKNQVGKIVGQIQSQYAKYLLAPLSALTLSSYTISVGLVKKLAGGVSSLATAFYPIATRGNVRDIYYHLQINLVILGIISNLIYHFWGFSILSWWLNSSELVAHVDQVMKILFPYFAILVLTPLPSMILDGANKPGIVSVFTLLTTAIEITTALILLPNYGLLAPAYAALLAIIITTPPLLFFTNKFLK